VGPNLDAGKGALATCRSTPLLSAANAQADGGKRAVGSGR